jgi:predicted metal-binding membrane protein
MRNSLRFTLRRAASSTDRNLTGSALETVLRRDRAIVVAALAALALLCWVWLAWLAASAPMASSMSDSAHGSMAGMQAGQMGWSPTQLLAMFLMWAIMMVGMMAPSVAPMILIYARVARQASRRGKWFASSAWFAFGYFLAWIGFAMLATLVQWGLERALLLSQAMTSASEPVGGAVLVAAGLYQWSPWKSACLSQCQTPLSFIQRHGGFRGTRHGAVLLGLRHGGYCIGCCWALMSLLFVAGVMNLLWIAAIGALILAEKLIPGRHFQRLTGLALIAGGIALIA